MGQRSFAVGYLNALENFTVEGILGLFVPVGGMLIVALAPVPGHGFGDFGPAVDQAGLFPIMVLDRNEHSWWLFTQSLALFGGKALCEVPAQYGV